MDLRLDISIPALHLGTPPIPHLPIGTGMSDFPPAAGREFPHLHSELISGQL